VADEQIAFQNLPPLQRLLITTDEISAEAARELLREEIKAYLRQRFTTQLTAWAAAAGDLFVQGMRTRLSQQLTAEQSEKERSNIVDKLVGLFNEATKK